MKSDFVSNVNVTLSAGIRNTVSNVFPSDTLADFGNQAHKLHREREIMMGK